MRILFLTPDLPRPADSGGLIKTASILDYLRRRHEVHTLCFRRRALSPEQDRWLASGRTETVLLNRGRTPLSLARSYLARVPISIERNRSGRMAQLVTRRLGEGSHDALFVDSWLMAQYLPPVSPGLSLLHEHNAEHVMWRRQAEQERNPVLKALAWLEYRRVRRYEAVVLRRFDAVFAVSKADRDALAALGAEPDRLRVLPNLPDPSLLERPALSFADAEPVILYFGTMSWPPNVEGLAYFLRDVFPLVRGRMPQARLVIAGRGAPAWLQRLARRTEGVEYVGVVPDAEPLYRRARLSVEASHSGGGTRLKVLNSLARGLPVVASPEGAEGIEARPGEQLLVADGPEPMADAVCRLMADDALWRSLSENGRELVRRRYMAESAYGPLSEVLSATAARA